MANENQNFQKTTKSCNSIGVKALKAQDSHEPLRVGALYRTQHMTSLLESKEGWRKTRKARIEQPSTLDLPILHLFPPIDPVPLPVDCCVSSNIDAPTFIPKNAYRNPNTTVSVLYVSAARIGKAAQN